MRRCECILGCKFGYLEIYPKIHFKSLDWSGAGLRFVDGRRPSLLYM